MDKKRIYYSKSFKRKALIDYSQGRNFEEILKSNGFNIETALKNDKKYCSKLLYKWKKELYCNNEIIYFINSDITQEDIMYEIEALDDYDEADLIYDNLNKKVKENTVMYEKHKNQINITNNKKEKYKKI